QKLHHRLEDMLHHPSFYHFSAADRLMPWVSPDTSVTDPTLRSTIVTSVLTTIWDADRAARRTRLAAVVTDLVKANKRVLLIAPDNRTLTKPSWLPLKGSAAPESSTAVSSAATSSPTSPARAGSTCGT